MDLRNTQIYLITSRVRLTIDSPRYSIMQVALGQICRMGANKPLAVSISWEISCTIILVSVSPNWRLRIIDSKLLRNPPSSCAARHPPGLLLNNLNIVDPEILWGPLSTLYFLENWGSQQSEERIITGAGLVQPGESYRAVRTGEFNRRTSENPFVIASIEAPLKSVVGRPKFVIFHTCTTFLEILSLYCVGLVVLVHLHPVW